MIRDFRENTEIKEKLFIVNVSKGITNKGVPYLNIVFQDASGQIEGRKWTVVEEDNDVFVKRTVVEVEAQVIKYGTGLQLKVMAANKLELSQDDIYDFAPASPVDRRVLQRTFVGYMDEIKQEEVHRVVEYLVKKNEPYIWSFPAATKNHHEYISGLLEHTVGMLKCAEAIANVYPILDKDFLYAGVILHDLGKIVELGDALAPHYTKAGKLLGHISIMQAEVAKACEELKINEEVSLLLQHMILSHHGLKDYGSPIPPLTREAEVLAAIDNLDARLNMINKALADVDEGEFSQRVMGLDGRTFYNPKIKK